MDWLFYENKYISQGKNLICGVDEAGRGPLAGPVCAAAVIMPEGLIIEGVNDSKKLTAKKREKLFDIIKNEAVCYSVAFASASEIDEINILNATHLAMTRAVEGLEKVPEVVLVDGNSLPKWYYDSEAIIKGDAVCHSIACASILAKVSRDRLMLLEAEKYPQYSFENHKGYGTKVHVQALKEHGPCPIHRKTFLKKILKTDE